MSNSEIIWTMRFGRSLVFENADDAVLVWGKEEDAFIVGSISSLTAYTKESWGISVQFWTTEAQQMVNWLRERGFYVAR